MNNKIYVNDDNVIYNYEVSFDKEEFEKIIDDIDLWYGKGELKAFIGVVCPEVPGKKTDIFAEVELFDDKKEFFYYQYIQHPLARTANAIINNQNSLESSKLIRLLATWNATSDEEKIFVIRLMSCFRFNRMNLGEVLLLDLTEEDKRNLFDRVVDAFKKTERETFVIAGSKEFCDDLEGSISSVVIDKEELLGIDTSEEKKLSKRRNIMALPRCKDINK